MSQIHLSYPQPAVSSHYFSGYTAIWDEPRGDNGKRKQRTKGGFKTKKSAQAFLAEQINRINNNISTSPTHLTVAEFLQQRWLPTLDARASMRDSYERNIARHVMPTLGAIKLQALTAERLTRFYRELSSSGHRYG